MRFDSNGTDDAPGAQDEIVEAASNDDQFGVGLQFAPARLGPRRIAGLTGAAIADVDPATLEPGAPRIAVNVYANTMTLLGTEKDVAAIAMASMPGVVRHITEIMWERLCVLFRENFPERAADEVLLISAAVFGANRTVAELCLTGVLKAQSEDLGKFLVAWHLRALEVPERQINRVVQLAVRAYRTRHGKASTSSR